MPTPATARYRCQRLAAPGVTDPPIIMSPVAPAGRPATALRFYLAAPVAPPAAVAGGGGFLVKVYAKNPINGQLALAFTVSLAYLVDAVFTLAPHDLVFEIGNVQVAGLVDLYYVEE